MLDPNTYYTPLRLSRPFAPGAVAVGVVTTWNPVDKASGVTLSNGNLTAHAASENDYVQCGVRATNSLSGKKYFRAVFDDNTGPADPAFSIGVATAAASLADRDPVTHSGVAFGIAAATIITFNNLHINGAFVSDAILTIALNDLIDVAVDIGNLKIWFRKNGTGLWNNIGGDDPATNTGGATLTSGTYYPYANVENGTGCTARFADDSSGTAPSGFSWMG